MADLLYGTTALGGSSGQGTVFCLSSDGEGNTFFDVLHSFAGGTGDGANPCGSLTSYGFTFNGHNTFYGMTKWGGSGGYGTVFQSTTSEIIVRGTESEITILHNFTGVPGDGANPYGSLTLSADGSTLYGMTYEGGSNNDGTVFQINTNGTGYTILHNFTGGSGDGVLPYGSLTLSGSALYGMTSGGGSSGKGVVFKLVPALILRFAAITVVANPSIGGTVSGGGTYVVGSSVQLSAAAKSGWTFTGWSDGVTTAIRSIIVPVDGATYTANFSIAAPAVATPTITPNGGTFAHSVSVALACGTAGAKIRYTINGTDPTSSSPAYSSPFAVTSTGTVKAMAFKPGYADSAVASASFTITQLAITTTSLPASKVGVAYNVVLQATGGTTPYEWSFVSGSMLPLLGLNLSSTGIISGKPTKSGTFNFTVKVTDAKYQTATRPLTLIISI